jgi:hypothetical protein
MRDLSSGKRIVLSKYFVAPAAFVRWVDPGAYVTFLPEALLRPSIVDPAGWGR